jgi:hypothetical protein
MACYFDRQRDLEDRQRNDHREIAALREIVNRLMEENAELKERMKQPHPMPAFKQWTPQTAAIAGECYAHNGAAWQCLVTTATEPKDGSQWICTSAPGKDGEDGRGLRVRSTYRPGGSYKALDMVMLNGSSFVAKVDNPGPCPSDNWQIVALQGKRGEKGETGVGERGPKGDSVKITDWRISPEGFKVLPVTSDAADHAWLDITPLLIRYHAEARD